MLPELDSMMPVVDGFSKPQWELINSCVESAFPEERRAAAWGLVEKQWLQKLCDDLGGNYSCTESDNFLMISESSPRLAKKSCKFFEKALKLILKYLPGVTQDEGYGKQIVLKFTDEDDYHRYTMIYHEDGHHPMSGGMCINEGCLHYAFYVDPDDPSAYRTTLVHELTHGCVNHLPLPAWLNEAIAMRMEQVICGTQVLLLDRHLLKEHLGHWNDETIQQFWSGLSWHLPDQGFTLSYSLALIIWNKIENDMRAPQEMILDFIKKAHYQDAGESACRELFCLSLGDFVEDFIGEGNWSPAVESCEILHGDMPMLE